MVMRTRAVAIELGEATAFVALMKEIANIRRDMPIRRTVGSVYPTRPAIMAAERLVTGKQTMARRLAISIEVDGSIRVTISKGATERDRACSVIIDANGAPTLCVEGEDDQTGATVSNPAFRKILDAVASPRPNRYGTRHVIVEGIRFDSAEEGKRYLQLKSMMTLGQIANLEMQVPYVFEENGKRCFRYIADFVYDNLLANEKVVEDVKGVPTDVYKLKKKLIEARYSITITEWPVPKKELERRARETLKIAANTEKQRKKIAREEARKAVGNAKSRKPTSAKSAQTINQSAT